MGESRASKRHRWRLPCEIVYEGGRQRSFVLDLSVSGLFVQTGARLKPGAEVEVRLMFEASPAPVVLRAKVARAKQVPSQLTTVAHGGVGLQLIDVSQEYLDALLALDVAGNKRAGIPEEVKPAPSVKRRFRVRVKQTSGMRSRSIELLADSAKEAGTLALREVGDGWEIASADRIAG